MSKHNSFVAKVDSIVVEKVSQKGTTYKCMFIKAHDRDQYPLFIGAQEALRIAAPFAQHGDKALDAMRIFATKGTVTLRNQETMFCQTTEKYGTLLACRVDEDDQRPFMKGQKNIAKMVDFIDAVGLDVFVAALGVISKGAKPQQYKPRTDSKPQQARKGGFSRQSAPADVEDTPAPAPTPVKPTNNRDAEIATLREMVDSMQKALDFMKAKLDSLESAPAPAPSKTTTTAKPSKVRTVEYKGRDYAFVDGEIKTRVTRGNKTYYRKPFVNLSRAEKAGIMKALGLQAAAA